MSYQGVRNGLVATIQGGGKWSASQISTCDFGIVEICASAIILTPGPNTTIRPAEFQSAASTRSKEIRWQIAGLIFVKDPGDPTAWLGNLWTAYDDIFTSVDRDDSLNGQAFEAHISTISRPDPDAFYRLNSVDYAVIKFSVEAVEIT